MKHILRLNLYVQKAAGLIGMACLLLLLILVLLSTATRALGITATFAEEFARYAIIVMASFGMSYTLMRRGHVLVDFLVFQLHGRWRDGLMLATNLLSLALFVAIAASCQDMWTMARAWGMTSNTDLAIPLWPVQFVLYLGFVLLAVQTVIDCLVIVCRMAGVWVEGGEGAAP